MRDLSLHMGQLFFSRGIVLLCNYMVVKLGVGLCLGGGWWVTRMMTKRSPRFGEIWVEGGILRPHSYFWHLGYYLTSLPAVSR